MSRSHKMAVPSLHEVLRVHVVPPYAYEYLGVLIASRRKLLYGSDGVGILGRHDKTRSFQMDPTQSELNQEASLLDSLLFQSDTLKLNQMRRLAPPNQLLLLLLLLSARRNKSVKNGQIKGEPIF